MIGERGVEELLPQGRLNLDETRQKQGMDRTVALRVEHGEVEGEPVFVEPVTRRFSQQQPADPQHARDPRRRGLVRGGKSFDVGVEPGVRMLGEAALEQRPQRRSSPRGEEHHLGDVEPRVGGRRLTPETKKTGRG